MTQEDEYEAMLGQVRTEASQLRMPWLAQLLHHIAFLQFRQGRDTPFPGKTKNPMPIFKEDKDEIPLV